MTDLDGRSVTDLAGRSRQPAQRRRAPRPRLLRGFLLGLAGLVLVACDSVDERAENHYRRGLELAAAGEPVKATLEFRNAIKLRDGHVGANLELGKHYQDTKNYSAAVFQFRKVIQLDATVLDAHLRLAQLLLAFNEVEAAATSAVAAAQLAPDDIDVVVLEAALAMRMGDMDRARAQAARAMAIAPDNGDVWVIEASISRRDGNLEKALGQIDEGLRRDPANVKALLFRLNLLGETGRSAEIGAVLETLIALEPGEPSFLEALVRWQLSAGRFDDAEKTLRRLSELAPDDIARALDIVRLIARTQGREPAIAELRRLIASRRGEPVAATLEVAMAEIEAEDGAVDAARERLGRVLAGTGEAGVVPTGEALQRVRLALSRFLIGTGAAETARGLELVQQVLADDASNSDALALRGRVRILEEDYDSAIRDLRAAENQAPDNVETMRLLAVAYQRNGNRDLAGERLSAAVYASGHGVEPVLDYARFLLAENKPEFAAGLLTEALKRRPGTVRLLDALARVRLQLRDFAGAEQIAEALRSQPSTADLGDRLLAAAFAGQERYDETIAILESASSASDRQAAYLGALVATHLRANDMAAAQALIEKAVAENPDDATALRLRGTIALARGEPEAAGPDFARAVELAPDDPVNHLSVYRLAMDGERVAEAEAALRAGIARTDSPLLRLNLAMLAERKGDIASAIAEYQRLYELQPGSELIANNLASLITDASPTPEQIDRAHTIVRRLRDTDVPHFKDTYGWVLHLKGEHRAALVAIEAAAAGLPDNPVVQYHLGRVLAELGEVERARAALTRALALAGGKTVPQIAGAQAALDALPAPAAAQ